ncbi:Oidioi.mRNA.OKI2018_I69.chr1.g3785.t1.cds [Oikopleura dioica]|uniref:Oidioi.mRNA.OKI2018_I69.chr1.g3785.t1.cds n=1 Tax=Oikopleura dioica TaxID=34765 RepID=A0ABN7SZ62_OIKDI|nr:Oidioi.mRNA.OKI2018_I69.chr1.g3785.t1.cds [Oikopleura dioica]
MANFVSRGIYYMDSNEEPKEVDLKELANLNLYGPKNPEGEETEKEATESAPENADPNKRDLKLTDLLKGAGAHYYFWLSNKDGGVPFKAVVEQLDCNFGKVHHRHELVSEKDQKGQSYTSFS